MIELKVEPAVLTVVTYSYLTSKELWRGSAPLTDDPHSLTDEILAPRERADYHTCISHQYEPGTRTMHVLVCATMKELLACIKDSSTFDNDRMICHSFHLNNAEWARKEQISVFGEPDDAKQFGELYKCVPPVGWILDEEEWEIHHEHWTRTKAAIKAFDASFPVDKYSVLQWTCDEQGRASIMFSLNEPLNESSNKRVRNTSWPGAAIEAAKIAISEEYVAVMRALDIEQETSAIATGIA